MRALRIMLVANDGLSAGHVARALAIARRLPQRAEHRGICVQLLLVTTSRANALMVNEDLAIVQMPSPSSARRAGFSDLERRHLVRSALEGVASAFSPDVIVVDTFPSGAHRELAGLGVDHAKRVLVRRAVPKERSTDERLTSGLTDVDLVIVADDPRAHEITLPVRSVRVPPITMYEASEARSRREAREQLGLGEQGRVVLIAAGGGGDADAVARSFEIRDHVARHAQSDTTAVVAEGPISVAHRTMKPHVRTIRVAPVQPLLAAFDGAFAPAGYNTAHELAKAKVPAALFAQPRPYDDQAGRAARFEAAGLAMKLDDIDEASIAAALDWMSTARWSACIEAGGADRAADAILDLVMGTMPKRREE